MVSSSPEENWSKVAELQGRVIGEDFRVERKLSEGGMGAVYVATQLSTGKQRALKVMHPDLVPDDKSRRRFADEAKVGSRIRSEHVVEVVSAGVDGELPWLAMELLEGRTLLDLVESAGAMTAAQAAETFSQIGHALEDAHRAGIIHRDLKPENIFIADSHRHGAQLTVKILDFGIAATIENSQRAKTVTSAIGSPLFIAPEQAKPGEKLTPTADVWALGLIAFYVLTGRHYWLASGQGSGGLHALLAEVLVHPLEPASARAAQLGAPDSPPPGFDRWFARCVDREPAARFASAGPAVAELVSILDGSSDHDAATGSSPSPVQSHAGQTRPLGSASVTAHLAAPAGSARAPGPTMGAAGRARRPWLVAVAIALGAMGLVGVRASRGPSSSRPGRTQTTPASDFRTEPSGVGARTVSAKSTPRRRGTLSRPW